MTRPAKYFRTWSVSIGGYPPALYAAPTAAKARWEAFESYREHRDCTFLDFIRLAHVRVEVDPEPGADGYDYIRRAYGFTGRIGSRVRLRNEGPSFNGREGVVVYPGRSTAYVRLVLDGERRISNVHPDSVEVLPTAAAQVGEAA